MAMGPRAFRFFLNLYPPYFFTRTRVKYFSADWKECVVELKRSILNRNYVGTAFGGAMFAATDPFYMLMLIRIMGIRDYVIWDKAATIEYLLPARSTLRFHFEIRDADLAKIHQDLQSQGKSLPVFEVAGIDRQGQVCVRVLKTLYIKRKRPED